MNRLSKLLCIIGVLFLPVALMVVILPTNEYEIIGIDAVDCDSPFQVMLFALPSYCIYGVIAFISIVECRKKCDSRMRKVLLCLVSIISILIMFAITPNVISALDMHSENKAENIEACGRGW